MTDAMTPEKAQEWIDALPKYKKGRAVLRDGFFYCCLGVLAQEQGDMDDSGFVDGSDLLLPSEKYGLSDSAQGELAVINDNSSTWEPVQDAIRKMFIDKEGL